MKRFKSSFTGCDAAETRKSSGLRESHLWSPATAVKITVAKNGCSPSVRKKSSVGSVTSQTVAASGRLHTMGGRPQLIFEECSKWQRVGSLNVDIFRFTKPPADLKSRRR